VPDERPDDETTSGGWLPPTGDEPITPRADPAGAPSGWLPPSDSSYTPPPARPEPAYAPPPSTGGWAGQGGSVSRQPYARESHGRATAALACSVVGLFICPVVFSVIAIVLGTQARREIDAEPERYGNRGQAQWGVNVGWIGLVLGIVLIIAIAAGVEITPSD
jgi:hypothetical protein